MTETKVPERKIVIKNENYGMSVVTLLVLILAWYYGKQQGYYWLWMASQIILILYGVVIGVFLIIILGSGMVLVWLWFKDWIRGR